MTIRKLSGVVQNYAWGSHSEIAHFQGRSVPTEAPEAEVWFGAHPRAPSTIEVDGTCHKLDAFIQESPNRELGNDVMRRYARLPFLLKILAVDQPLSIQLHPSHEQAQKGFQRERSLGISSDDPRANYRDDWPKPELLCPLTEFEVLCGFRPIEELISLFGTLGGECFEAAKETLKSSPNAQGLRQVATAWLNAAGDAKSALFDAAIEAYSRVSTPASFPENDVSTILDLAQRYPGDMGVIVTSLLRHLVLSPAMGLFVPAGVLHAYLRGFAIEVMANSDNVLRGGLTPKHVDVVELLGLTNFNSDRPLIVPLQERWPLEKNFVTDASQFAVSRIDIENHVSWCATKRSGPEMLLCVKGNLSVIGTLEEQLELARSECAWISADEDVYCVSGAGQAFRVQVGTVLPAECSGGTGPASRGPAVRGEP